MISNKFTIYTKGQKVTFKIIDVLQIIFGLSLSGLIIWSMLVMQNTINIWTITMGLAAIISLLDLVVHKTFKKNTFLHNIFLKIYQTHVVLFQPMPSQVEVCTWINTRVQNQTGILIYGKANVGKTSSVFLFLSHNTKEKHFLQTINWAESILYIDCKSDKSDILDMFNAQIDGINTKIYEKSLIIVDNIETMGETFINNLLNVINSSASTFILLADTDHLDSHLYNIYDSKCMKDSYTFAINRYTTDNFQKIYGKLADREKIVLLIIYYISLSLTLIQVKEVRDVLGEDYSFLHLKRIISSLLRKGLIKYFPFDQKYILLMYRTEMEKKPALIWQSPQNIEAVDKILQNSKKFPESAWFCLIRLPYAQIQQISLSEREQLFRGALSCGNYMTLYDALHDEIMYSPIKENLFLYETGTLFFYNSQQGKAFEKYNLLINQKLSDAKKYRVILRIIESTHGDINPVTMNNINSYLELLADKNYEYSLYSKYWKLHIETERGTFLLDNYEKLLLELNTYNKKVKEKEIYKELVKRCYTDIIRSHHILKKTLSDSLVSNFMGFLNSYYPSNSVMQKYYESLYVKANTLHYVDMFDKLIKGENCHATYDEAIMWYSQAIACGYENFKSVSACDLKCIDLKLFGEYHYSDMQNYEKTIKKFLSNAEINKVSVHVAYCKTLLAKLYMIQNLYDEEYRRGIKRKTKNDSIKTCLREAKKIYTNYKNDYGIIRIEILELLYSLATVLDRETLECTIKKMADILENHQEYQREMEIIRFLTYILTENKSFGMLALSILKAYPIIMQ